MGGYTETSTSYCSFAICPYFIQVGSTSVNGTDPPKEPIHPICFTGKWSAWGEWGECEPCSTSIERYRTRDRECVSPCKDVQHNKDCIPGTDRRERKVTNKESMLCNPCPPEFYAKWGAWGPWSMASKTCGEEHFSLNFVYDNIHQKFDTGL